MDEQSTEHLSREEMVRYGLMEAEWYRDFNPGQDCFPEDDEYGENLRY